MKIQLAIDRVTIERAKEIAGEAGPYIDIVEVGTSLIKDYGISSVRSIKELFPSKAILADMKTIDEGAYEFNAAFSNGADIATVMGASSVDTIMTCEEVTKRFKKLMMIDLLGLDDKKIYGLKKFSDAIFCIHAPSDEGGNGLTLLLRRFKGKFPEIGSIAVAGGVNLRNISDIKKADADIVIIGGAITRSGSVRDSAKKFREMV
ncbi:MAG: orotidine 5'-phosphate decarboxylase [Clostridiales bacterium]|nr:orotidine 5'-phosphate decarboxylase [Clostridiales bacterium]